MIFDGLKFHNVAEMVPDGDGHLLYRLPKDMAEKMNTGIRDRTAFMCSGVEIRFRLQSERVTLHLKARPAEEAQTALIYFGTYPGGWQFSTKTIGTEDTAITIEYPQSIRELEQEAKKNEAAFSPYLVRLLLPYGVISYLGKEGETLPPQEGDEPALTLLSYGSSITHGSLGLVPTSTYAFEMASGLRLDTLNQGYAGSAHMEKEMAEYLCSRRDWHVCTLEMGVNMLGTELNSEQYERRIAEFLEIMKQDGRPLFATDIFTFRGDSGRAEEFRAIVKRQTKRLGICYTPGIELLREVEYVSADNVHPTWEGQMTIARRWGKVIRENLSERVTRQNQF
ncbi:MAG: SGNH/GDSL hydrolase family protein [Clostridia bacterium]|nr:SGNH/GDSL hydrolase family protein [Clostridia bacterium]